MGIHDTILLYFCLFENFHNKKVVVVVVVLSLLAMEGQKGALWML